MGITILDGAMGTELQKRGLQLGEIPEVWNIEKPEKIREVHLNYIMSGSDIIYTNTFGANRRKMSRVNYSVDELIRAAINNGREAVKMSGKSVKVALDIGPIGALIEPLGDMSFEEAYDIFKEMVVAAEDADAIFIETMTDIYETKAAVLAAKENSNLPVYVTMSFEENQRTFTGTSIDSMAMTLEGLGVDGIGFNCSLGPTELAPMVKKLYSLTSLPIIFKPNAGLPDPVTNKYNVSPEEFATLIKELLPYGIEYLGGCCGTAPEYISALCDMLGEVEEEKKNGTYKLPDDYKELTYVREHRPGGICSPTKAVYLTEPRVIGERINPTGKKRFKEALLAGDMDYILNQAISQVEAGADILDVNVGLPGIDEKDMMCRVIKALQAVVDVPLQIDSNDPVVLEAALRVYNGKPIVNSVNGEEISRQKILPLVKKYGASVVGLALDENGIGKSAEERFAVAKKIVKSAEETGIDRRDIYIDCLTLTASAEQEAVIETLKAVKMVHDELGLNCVLGVSNISFGLPNRELVNSTFLTMALYNGLTLPIINPNNEGMMGAIRAYKLLVNIDKNSMEYMEAYRDYVPNKAVQANTAIPSVASNLADDTANEIRNNIQQKLGDEAAGLFSDVVKGLANEGENKTEALLSNTDSMTIVNEILIPALDVVGAGFEKGTLYLPQLILSASVVQGAFSKIKEHLAKTGTESVNKGTVIVATVKGDVHDIGKNIVKVLLENYGFNVIDLGKDVEIQAVVDAAKKYDVKLVGLSALMTTTLGSMEDTIKALRREKPDCKIVVGGAVLTADYAEKIGADFYSKDAKETVDIAKNVFQV